jgi:hypothetical protein
MAPDPVHSLEPGIQRSKNDPCDAGLIENVKIPFLLPQVHITVSKQQGMTVLSSSLLCAAGNVHEKGVANIRQDQANRPAASSRQ